MGDTTTLLNELISQLNQLNFIRIMAIIVIAWLLIRTAEHVVAWLIVQVPDRLRFYLLPIPPTFKLIVVVAACMAIIQLLFGSSRENLLAAFVAVGIGLGFAFREYLSSVVAGIVAIYERPYRPGDWVQIEDAYGEVQSLGFRTVSIVTPDDTTVTIPHKKLWDVSVFNNNSGQQEHMCVANFYLHPEHDAASVQQKLYEVALTSPYLQLKRPIVVVVAEKPWGTHYRLKAYPIDGRDEFKFTTDLTIRGKMALAKLGVTPISAPASVASS